MSATFFPYHPAKLRWALLASALLSVALAAWALSSALWSTRPLEWVRAGLGLGLTLAMGTVWSKLGPRRGWGITVLPAGLVVSRPIEGQLEIPWSAVTGVRRDGRGRGTLVLALSEDRRVLVPAHLFASRAQFEAMAASVDELLPSHGHDA